MSDATVVMEGRHSSVEIRVRLDVLGEPPSYTDIPPPDVHQKPTNPDVPPHSPPPYHPTRLDKSAEEGMVPAFLDSVRQPSRGFLGNCKGWRAALLGFSSLSWGLAAAGVFILGLTKPAYDEPAHTGPTATVFTVDCASMKNYRIWLHLLLAVLSAALLTAAGYTAHVYTSPTRSEVHAAHKQRRSLEVGALSLRNLFYISWWRRAGALAAIICAIFLPVFYNATFYATFVNVDYNVGLVSENFFNHHATFDTHAGKPLTGWQPIESRRQTMMSDRNVEAVPYKMPTTEALVKWKNVTIEECLTAYTKGFVGSSRNVLAVTTVPRWQDEQDLIGFHAQKADPLKPATHQWFCGGNTCEPTDLDPSAWTLGPDRTPVAYCLIEPVSMPSQCRLQASRPLLAVASSLTLLLSLAMTSLLLFQRKLLFVVQGDALASFLDAPDRFTTGMCTLSQHELTHTWSTISPYPRRWRPGPDVLWSVPSRGRWARFHWTAGLLALAGAVEYFMVCYSTEPSLTVLFRYGFGRISPSTAVDFLRTTSPPSSLLQSLPSHLLLAALPQALIASIWTLLYYPLLSTLTAAAEYASYAHTRHGLRVSRAPLGHQRSTLGLSVPYYRSLWLFAELCLLTFLTGQALSVGRVDFLAADGALTAAYHALHWNSPAIVMALALVVPPLLLAPSVVGMAPAEGPPVAGLESAVLAAAGQPAEGEGEAWVAPSVWRVAWGVGESDRAGIGHLGFSVGRVQAVGEGDRFYF
ncbi:hypothetical protein EDC01DRAFT_674941 [Geopyxis carbonaria]|nr:hypothetical protein EDC01DRAFT_674941 [Geopyxis carbonaria]